jgi:hypothetical protein
MVQLVFGVNMSSWHPDSDMKDKIKHECSMISDLLCSKNESYGDSACSPIQIFSKLDADDAICARIDDKLSRIANRGLNGETEDTLFDLIGYLVLLKIARENKNE